MCTLFSMFHNCYIIWNQTLYNFTSFFLKIQLPLWNTFQLPACFVKPYVQSYFSTIILHMEYCMSCSVLVSFAWVLKIMYMYKSYKRPKNISNSEMKRFSNKLHNSSVFYLGLMEFFIKMSHMQVKLLD